MRQVYTIKRMKIFHLTWVKIKIREWKLREGYTEELLQESEKEQVKKRWKKTHQKKKKKLTEREVSTHPQLYALIQSLSACAHSLLSASMVCCLCEILNIIALISCEALFSSSNADIHVDMVSLMSESKVWTLKPHNLPFLA